mgnify:CR=1 FL=1
MNDDYVTMLSKRKNPYTEIAKELLRIESASERFKRSFHAKGVIERILKILPGPCIFWEGTRNQVSSLQTPNVEPKFIYMSLELSEGGHFAAGYVDDTKNTLYIYDSMCSSCGPHNDYKYFEKAMKKFCPGRKVVLVSSNAFYQPSGGFCVNTKTQMKNLMQHTLKKTDNYEDVFHLHHFDTMSQHHFCYIEALVFLFHMAFGTPLGPKNDPDKRLVFIKKVGWGLLKTFTKSKMDPTYFSKYMTLEGTRFNKGLTIPVKDVRYVVKDIQLPSPKVLVGVESVDVPRLWSLFE